MSIGESHVLADHESDGKVRGAPRGGKEGSVRGPHTFRFTQN